MTLDLNRTGCILFANNIAVRKVQLASSSDSKPQSYLLPVHQRVKHNVFLLLDSKLVFICSFILFLNSVVLRRISMNLFCTRLPFFFFFFWNCLLKLCTDVTKLNSANPSFM